MLSNTLYGKSVCSCSFSLLPFQIKETASLICAVSSYHSLILTTSFLDKYHIRYDTLYDPRILIFFLDIFTTLCVFRYQRQSRLMGWSIRTLKNDDDPFSEDCTRMICQKEFDLVIHRRKSQYLLLILVNG